jgi:hypothetical protein
MDGSIYARNEGLKADIAIDTVSSKATMNSPIMAKSVVSLDRGILLSLY